MVVDVAGLAEVVAQRIEHEEGRKDRQDADRRDDREEQEVGEAVGGPSTAADDFGRGRRVFDPADHAAGRAVPALARADPRTRRDRGEVRQLGTVADHARAADRAGRADRGPRADGHGPDDEFGALDLGIGDEAAAADAGMVPDRQQVGCADADIGDQRIVSDARAEQAEIDVDRGRALQPAHVDELGQSAREPPPVIVGAPERVATRSHAPEDQPLARDRDDGDPAVDEREDHEQDAELASEAEARAADQQIGDEDAEPLRRREGDHEGQGHGLRQPAQETAAERRRLECEIAHSGLRPRAAGAGDERVGDPAQRPFLVDVLQRDGGERRRLADRTDEAGGEQRVAAKVGEEIALQRDRLVAEDLLGGREHGRLGLVLGRLLFAVGVCDRQRRDAERLAVDLPGGETRQHLGRLEMAGHHVGRHLLGERPPQRRPIEPVAALRYDEGDETVDAVVAPQHHRRLIDPGLRLDPRLDLAEFHAEPADLDLIVDPAVEQDVPGGIERDRIARAVEQRIGTVRCEGVRDELVRGQLGPLQVALRDAGTADQQFARLAASEQTKILAGDVDRVVGDRPADGDRRARVHLGRRRDHRGFGRPVGVEQLSRRRRPAHDQRLRQRLAAEQDEAHARQVVGDHGEQGRHGVDHRDVGRSDDPGQRFDVAHHRRARDEQRRADEVRDPDLLHREVEGDGRALEHDVVGRHPVQRVPRAQEMADVGVADDDALRHAGRAGGVDQVGGMVRGQPGRAQVRRRRVGGRLGEQGVERRCGNAGGRAGRERRRDQQGLRGGVGEADRDPVGRSLGVEGQPGGARERDADLRGEQVGTACHPEADHVAGSDPAMRQPRGDPRGAGEDLGIGETRVPTGGVGDGAVDQRRVIRACANRVGEDFAQKLVADQVGTGGAAQHGPVGWAHPGVPVRCGPDHLAEATHRMLRFQRRTKLGSRMSRMRTAAAGMRSAFLTRDRAVIEATRRSGRSRARRLREPGVHPTFERVLNGPRE